MKKLFLTVLVVLLVTPVFAGQFAIRLIAVTSKNVTIAIPINTGGTSTFYVSVVNGSDKLTTDWTDSQIDAFTVTTTVQLDNSETEYYIYATEKNASPVYASGYLTITSKPALNEVMQDRDSYTYEETQFVQSWRTNVVAIPGDIVNTTWTDYSIHLLEIIVTGEEIGNVAMEIDGVIVRRYSYKADSTSGQIFSSKIKIPKDRVFRVFLEAGNIGQHSVSITGEKIKQTP